PTPAAFHSLSLHDALPICPVAILSGAMLFLLSCYHFYTAGFGIPQATTHRGLHMGVSLFLVFISFSAFSSSNEKARGPSVLGLRSEEHTSELQSRENLVCR